MIMHRVAVVVAVLASGLSVQAGLTGTFESFEGGGANWLDGSSSTVVWSGSGSFDGSAFISSSASFTGTNFLDPVVLFRAQTTSNASGGAFVGDYITAGVTGLSFQMRHNASVPVNMFVRYSVPAFFPGVIAERFIDIAAGSWQEIFIPLDEMLPEIKVTEELAGTFLSVMSNVAHLQLGVTVSNELAGLAGPFTFDLDQVTLVPTPGVAGLFGLAGCLGLAGRRRDRR